VTPFQVAEKFVSAINSKNIDLLVSLMTPEHVFVDASGTEHLGREKMRSVWPAYFRSVPDYLIEVSERFEKNGTVVLLGHASGTYSQTGELKPENHWNVPAAWRAVVVPNLVSSWQQYVNELVMQKILDRMR
jgi:ketosteroid isomerase-like protein